MPNSKGSKSFGLLVGQSVEGRAVGPLPISNWHFQFSDRENSFVCFQEREGSRSTETGSGGKLHSCSALSKHRSARQANFVMLRKRGRKPHRDLRIAYS